jgi:hypothetical protein
VAALFFLRTGFLQRGGFLRREAAHVPWVERAKTAKTTIKLPDISDITLETTAPGRNFGVLQHDLRKRQRCAPGSGLN